MTRQKTNKKPNSRQRLKQQARLAVVPQKANQYRPHLVRRWGLLAVLLLVFAMQAVYNVSTEGSVLGEGSDLSASGLLASTNQARAEQGLGELAVNPDLSRAATLKAQDMIRQQYWAHTAPDGTTPWAFFDRVGYSYAAAGENLARNFRSADATVAAWLASKEHRDNVLADDYSEVGFAVVSGPLDGRMATIVVAHYGTPAEPVVAGTAVEAPVFAAASGSGGLNPIARFGVAVQSLTPAAIGSLMLLLIVTVVAMLAHSYRHHLPKRLKRTWYRHHGVIKSAGLMTVALVMMVLLYGGGQI